LFDQFGVFRFGLDVFTEKLSVGNASITAGVEDRNVETDELLPASTQTGASECELVLKGEQSLEHLGFEGLGRKNIGPIAMCLHSILAQLVDDRVFLR